MEQRSKSSKRKIYITIMAVKKLNGNNKISETEAKYMKAVGIESNG